MDELNRQLNEEFLESVKGDGRPIISTPEECEKNKEYCMQFNNEENKAEKQVRVERARASADPEVYLTF